MGARLCGCEAAESVALDHVSSRHSAHKWCPRPVGVWAGRMTDSKSITSGGPRDEAEGLGYTLQHDRETRQTESKTKQHTHIDGGPGEPASASHLENADM